MGTEPRGDRELVTAYQGGEVAAFEEIDRRYRPVAKRVCSRILFDQADVEDAVQDTMLAVYRRLPTFNGQYLLGPYVARIATNRSLDLIRYRKRRPQLPLTESLAQSIEADSDPVDQILILDDAASVGRVLGEIPPTHARALEMRANDASHEEIAKDLDLTAPKAKALLHRARGTFRQAWLARLSAIIAAVGAALRKTNDGLAPAPTTIASAPMATGSSQLMATVSNLSANAAPLINAAVAAEPVVQSASRVVATTAAAVLTIGSAGAGVMFSQNETAVESFVDPRPAVTQTFEASPESPPPWSETPLTTTSASPEPSSSAPATSPEPSPSATTPEASASPAPSQPTPSQEPSRPPAPSQEPSPKPSQPAPSQPEPAPFSARMAADTPSQDRCDCSEQTRLRASERSGSPSGRMLATWTLDGGILEASGKAAWSHQSFLSFDVEGEQGSATMTTKVIGSEFSYRYDVQMVLDRRAPGHDGGAILTFSGPFSDVDGPFGQGTLTVVLAVDPNGKPVQLGADFRSA